MKSTRSQLIRFFAIAFAWSWLVNLPRLIATLGWITLSPAMSEVLRYAAVFGPYVAAIMLTGLQSGRSGIKVLLRRGWDTRFQKRWWLPTLLLMPAMGLLTVLVLHLLNQPIPWEYSLSPAMVVPVGLLILLLNAYPEEYGWRGYALDRLQDRFSPLVASLVLGMLWALWHLPLHFIEGTSQAAIPIAEFMVQTIVLSLLYTWLHDNTGGSVLVASLFHTMGILTGAIFPCWTTTFGRWCSLLLLLVPAVIIARAGLTKRHVSMRRGAGSTHTPHTLAVSCQPRARRHTARTGPCPPAHTRPVLNHSTAHGGNEVRREPPPGQSRGILGKHRPGGGRWTGAQSPRSIARDQDEDHCQHLWHQGGRAALHRLEPGPPRGRPHRAHPHPPDL